MNDQQLDKKLRKDAARVKKDLRALMEDGTTRVNRYVDSVSQSTGKTQKELTARVGDDVSQLSKGFEKLMDSATGMMQKDVEPVMRHYKTTAQKAVAKVIGKRRPSFFSRPGVRYTLAGLSLALVMGLVLGSARWLRQI